MNTTEAAGIESAASAHREANAAVGRTDETEYITQEYINELETEMMAAAEALEFERAASLRDRITQLNDSVGEKLSSVEPTAKTAKRRGRRIGAKLGGRIPRPKRRT